MRIRKIDLTGQKFSRLTVIKPIIGLGKYECRCDCGIITTAKGWDLIKRNVMSCGCFSKESLRKRMFKHGFSGIGNGFYSSWQNMIQRCTTHNKTHYPDHGERGIRVCKRWFKFQNFHSDMFSEWREGLSIERLDNDRGYLPENCVWATQKVQSNHTRRNRLLTVYGKTQTIAQWHDETGIPYATIWYRTNVGWPVSKILNLESHTFALPRRI